ncbi:Protein NSG2 [Spathaspora sp. JA1]|nr:Protein NSG2 [Spathaspora sp. JA1]
MSDLRKSAILNSTPGSMSSAASGGETSTRLQTSESETNLTKPYLYGVYGNDDLYSISKETEENDLEIVTRAQEIEKKKPTIPTIAPQNLFKLPLILRLLILSSSAFLYNEITKHINYKHFSDNKLANIPVTISNIFVSGFFSKFRISTYFPVDSEYGQFLDQLLALTIQGIGMGLLHPIMDRSLPRYLSRRLLSSNPYPTYSTSYSNLFNDLIRSCITFLGISYAIRKIEWSSFLQVSIVWSLLNPGLWLLLDGTPSGFLASLVGSLGACGVIYLENYTFLIMYGANSEDTIALWLWIGSFFFSGIIIFGKLGRGLF